MQIQTQQLFRKVLRDIGVLATNCTVLSSTFLRPSMLSAPSGEVPLSKPLNMEKSKFAFATSGLVILRIVKITSSAVTGSPSDQTASSRILIVKVRLSSVVTLSASR